MSQERDTNQQRPETPKGHWTNSEALSAVLGAFTAGIALLGIIFAMLYGFYVSINERLDRQEARYIAALEESDAKRAKALEESDASNAKALEEMKDELGGKIDGWGKRIVAVEESVGVLSSDIASLKTQIEELGGPGAASWMFTAPTSIPFHMDADALKYPVLTIWADDIVGLSPESRTWLAVPLFTAPAVFRGDMGTGTLGHLPWTASPEGI